MKQCSICGERFDNSRTFSNHVRWKHKIKKSKCKFCNYETTCNISLHEDSCLLNPKNIKHCKQCDVLLTSTDQDQFCSRSCSATYNNTNRILSEKISTCCNCGINITLKCSSKKYCDNCKHTVNVENNKLHIKNYKERNAGKPLNRVSYEKSCVICNEKFLRFSKNIKTCSSKCKSALLSKLSTQNPNCGGETNYKRFIYNDVIFDSSWEVEIAKFLDEHQIKWSRSRKHLLHWTDSNGEQRRYYPDFFLKDLNVYVDPKNPYKQKQDKEKLDFIKQSVILIVGNVNECKQQIFKLISK